jgi:hypothetical protein
VSFAAFWGLCICKGNIKPVMNSVDCVLIAGIHTSEVSLKLWVGKPNLQFPYHHIIVDWQKQCKI